MEQGAQNDFLTFELSDSMSDLAYETSHSFSHAHSTSFYHMVVKLLMHPQASEMSSFLFSSERDE